MPTFLNTSQFLFAQILEDHYSEIVEEYHQAKEHFNPWQETHLHNGGWEVFGLYDFPSGNAIEDNIKLCPITATLINEFMPTHGAAGFSRLAPKTKIAPHKGYQGDFLRYHLGIDVPPGDCFIQVGNERTSWANGKSLVFDDRDEHLAENNTDVERVILLIDFVPTF